MLRLSAAFAAAAWVVFATNVAHCATTASALYWSGSVGIRRANLDGSGLDQVTTEGLSDLAVDSQAGRIYHSGYDVGYTALPSGQRTSLFDLPGSQIYNSLALDKVHSHIYFVEALTSTIYRTDFDGSNPTVIIPTDGQNIHLTRIEHVQVDPVGGKLYWTYQQTFRRSNLDGSQQEWLFSHNSWITDFELDPASNKIYWTSTFSAPGSGSVKRANYDGSGSETLVSGGLWGVYGLALDLNAGKMYFSDAWTAGPTDYDNTIRVANLDGSMAHTVINLGPGVLALPGRVALGTTTVPEPSSSILSLIALVWLRGRRRCNDGS